MANQFGSLLKTARDSAGLSQRDLGSLIGVTGSAVASWEAGRPIPDRARVAELADALGLNRMQYAALEEAARLDSIDGRVGRDPVSDTAA